MSNELLTALFETTLTGSAAIVLVMAVRRWVADRFGARIAYLLWTAVPAAMAAVLLPARVGEQVLTMEMRLGPLQPLMVEHALQRNYGPWLLALWIAGAATTAIFYAVRQCRFVSRLGHLRRRADGLYEAGVCAGLPAVIGVLRPRIVVPSDFDLRYNEQERCLVLQHERAHLCRGDLQVNAALTLISCLYWFNPLVQLAARYFRHDQELSCDQAVIARFPQQRRTYGDAMLKTQLAVDVFPLACHWGGHHLLKERIAMLKFPLPSRRRTKAGSLLAVSFALTTAAVAWAMQPPQADAPRPVLKTSTEPPAAVTDVVAMRTPAPPYPEGVAKQGVSGQVLLRILVGTDGKPKDVRVEKADPAGVFDAASIQAAKQWTFVPKQQDGKPVEGWIRVPIYFDAKRQAADAATPSGHSERIRAMNTVVERSLLRCFWRNALRIRSAEQARLYQSADCRSDVGTAAMTS
ncbi:TonB family protein [Pseudoxanthomonas sp. UTMC 1351]|uniref:TonB family protein n=1 Tax=Pseudoxanthomonas sp. UTMC 1351 TaxID=2695853 RepID=UPI0034CF891A